MMKIKSAFLYSNIWTPPWLTRCGLKKHPELNLEQSKRNEYETHTHTETCTHVAYRLSINIDKPTHLSIERWSKKNDPPKIILTEHGCNGESNRVWNFPVIISCFHFPVSFSCSTCHTINSIFWPALTINSFSRGCDGKRLLDLQQTHEPRTVWHLITDGFKKHDKELISLKERSRGRKTITCRLGTKRHHAKISHHLQLDSTDNKHFADDEETNFCATHFARHHTTHDNWEIWTGPVCARVDCEDNLYHLQQVRDSLLIRPVKQGNDDCRDWIHYRLSARSLITPPTLIELTLTLPLTSPYHTWPPTWHTTSHALSFSHAPSFILSHALVPLSLFSLSRSLARVLVLSLSLSDSSIACRMNICVTGYHGPT